MIEAFEILVAAAATWIIVSETVGRLRA